MQMTVLPYLVVTLVGGLGQLDPATARRLGLRAAALLCLLLVLACAVIAVMPLAYPSLVSASFYSDALVEPAQPFALGELYVPANPFYAMANAIVPGLVLFSTALGVALIGVPEKAPLIAMLQALERAVVRVTQFVLGLTPYGVFAISASAAGTMSPESLARLQVYFIVFGAAALLLTFVIIPLAVAALTPFRWRQVVGMCQEALLTAFVANSAFIVLPMLVEKVKAALAAQTMDASDTRSAVDVVVPISLRRAQRGKLLTLLFVPFAAWLAGDPLGADAYATLFGAGVPSYFAKAQVALPFLMDLLGVPHDLFQLYIPSSIVTGKFDSMVTVMSLLALALLTAARCRAGCSWQLRRIVPALAIIAGRHGAHGGRAEAGPGTCRRHRLPQGRGAEEHAPATRHAAGHAAVRGAAGRGRRRRRRCSASARAACCAWPSSATACRSPSSTRVATWSAWMSNWRSGWRRTWARHAGRFVPADFPDGGLLADGRIDLAMGMPYLSELLPAVAYSLPYLDSTLGLVVRDELRDDFASVTRLARREPVTIALLADLPGLQERLREQLAGVELRFVTLSSPKEFLEGRAPQVDAFGCWPRPVRPGRSCTRPIRWWCRSRGRSRCRWVSACAGAMSSWPAW